MGKYRSDDELAAAWHEVMQRYHRLTCLLDRELIDNHDLTSSEFDVLEQLVISDGHSQMANLADNVHLSQSALSRLVGRLEKDGLVVRNMCKNDRRAVYAEISPQGRERYDAAKKTHRHVLRGEADRQCVADGICGENKVFTHPHNTFEQAEN